MTINIEQLNKDIKSVKESLVILSTIDNKKIDVPTDYLKAMLEDVLKAKTHELYNLQHTLNIIDDLRSCLNCTESIKNSCGSVRCMRYDMDVAVTDRCFNHNYIDGLVEEYIEKIKE